MPLHPQSRAMLAESVEADPPETGPPAAGSPGVGLDADQPGGSDAALSGTGERSEDADWRAERLQGDRVARAECGDGPEVAEVSDLSCGGVRCRLYHPLPGTELGVLIYLHGGGWVAGSLETVDAACRRLAVTSGHPVLSVDYRLAPEHPWPAAVEDADTVIGWIRDYGTERGLDPARIGVAGDSAGGTLAAVAARRQRDAGTPLAFQGLVYPVVDPSAKTESYREFAVGYGLDAELMARFWELYVPEKANRAHPDAAPRCAESLAGLPPALIVTAEYDVLRDEGEEYAAALSEAGVPTVTIRYAGMVHSFFRKVALFDAAGVAIDQVALAARAALAHATPVPR